MLSHHLIQNKAELIEILRSLGIAHINADNVQNICKHLFSLGCKSALVEGSYVDQDFSEDYSAFYSTVFRPYTKVCKRIHFFSSDCATAFTTANPAHQIAELEKIAVTEYLGYIVVRPIGHAPLGRTWLKCRADGPPTEKNLLVRSVHEVHLGGARLKVEGFPFIEQDQRTGCCAHASMWMSLRHFQIRHRERWVSMAQISESATKTTDMAVSQAVPAGSTGLSVDNMLRALRDTGRHPIAYSGVWDPSKPAKKPEWRNGLKPLDIIHRYVDSAIPVIIGLAPWRTDTREGHAVTAVGLQFSKMDGVSNTDPDKTRAIFCTSILVNDDQRGPYLQMSTNGASADTPYSLEDVLYIIVPLPHKVFLLAETAEAIGLYTLEILRNDVARLKLDPALSGQFNPRAFEQFYNDKQSGKVIARTYLTPGWKYHSRIAQSSLPEDTRANILTADLPKFVWVVELGLFDELNHDNPTDRTIAAHFVIDATSHTKWENVLIAQVPGYTLIRKPNFDTPRAPYQTYMLPVSGNGRMKPRHRNRTPSTGTPIAPRP